MACLWFIIAIPLDRVEIQKKRWTPNKVESSTIEASELLMRNVSPSCFFPLTQSLDLILNIPSLPLKISKLQYWLLEHYFMVFYVPRSTFALSKGLCFSHQVRTFSFKHSLVFIANAQIKASLCTSRDPIRQKLPLSEQIYPTFVISKS